VTPSAQQETHEAAKNALKAGDFATAERLLCALLFERPNDAEAMCDLGTALVRQGRTDEAIATYERAITLAPRLARAHGNLGNALRARGETRGALAAYERAIAIQPSPAHYFNLGNLHREAGESERAIGRYREAIALAPNHAAAHHNLGRLLLERGDAAGAERTFRAALSALPAEPMLRAGLSSALLAQRRLDEALDVADDAELEHPESFEAARAVGNALAVMGDHEGAVEALARAQELAPQVAEVESDLGCSLLRLDRFEEAELALRSALERRPTAAHHANLAAALLAMGEHEESLAESAQAVELDPLHLAGISNYLLALHYGSATSPEELFARHVALGPRFGAPGPAPARDRDPERRLRVGYLSPDLRRHSVAYFVESLFASHTRAAFDVVLFVDSASDEVTARLRAHATESHDVWGTSDAELARLVERERIDVLVDLAGHTDGNRLALFAQRAAPVQVTYLGYPDTTGLAAMDVRVSDAHADPPGEADARCLERLARVPVCAWCYRPADEAPEVSPAPCVSRGFVTFGSFNASAKLDAPWLDVWARLLAALPDARLLVKARSMVDVRVRQRVGALFAARGVAAARLDLRGFAADMRGHLATYADVDIALDAFPYHGTTTTCEALWMGVPVVSRAGLVHASRVGKSLLSAVGHAELVAESDDDFIRIASELAADRARLTALRTSLREDVARSPLTDGPRLARALEDIYRAAWRRHVTGR
jgi:protein O-GlcNAc transferase